MIANETILEKKSAENIQHVMEGLKDKKKGAAKSMCCED